MKLELVRKSFTDKSTIGKLYINDVYECMVLEDVVRDSKIPGETAIPYGEYEVKITYSPRFKRVLHFHISEELTPLLLRSMPCYKKQFHKIV
jgi:hypothetical protein